MGIFDSPISEIKPWQLENDEVMLVLKQSFLEKGIAIQEGFLPGTELEGSLINDTEGKRILILLTPVNSLNLETQIKSVLLHALWTAYIAWVDANKLAVPTWDNYQDWLWHMDFLQKIPGKGWVIECYQEWASYMGWLIACKETIIPSLHTYEEWWNSFYKDFKNSSERPETNYELWKALQKANPPKTEEKKPDVLSLSPIRIVVTPSLGNRHWVSLVIDFIKPNLSALRNFFDTAANLHASSPNNPDKLLLDENFSHHLCSVYDEVWFRQADSLAARSTIKVEQLLPELNNVHDCQMNVVEQADLVSCGLHAATNAAILAMGPVNKEDKSVAVYRKLSFQSKTSSSSASDRIATPSSSLSTASSGSPATNTLTTPIPKSTSSTSNTAETKPTEIKRSGKPLAGSLSSEKLWDKFKPHLIEFKKREQFQKAKREALAPLRDNICFILKVIEGNYSDSEKNAISLLKNSLQSMIYPEEIREAVLGLSLSSDSETQSLNLITVLEDLVPSLKSSSPDHSPTKNFENLFDWAKNQCIDAIYHFLSQQDPSFPPLTSVDIKQLEELIRAIRSAKNPDELLLVVNNFQHMSQQLAIKFKGYDIRHILLTYYSAICHQSPGLGFNHSRNPLLYLKNEYFPAKEREAKSEVDTKLLNAKKVEFNKVIEKLKNYFLLTSGLVKLAKGELKEEKHKKTPRQILKEELQSLVEKFKTSAGNAKALLGIGEGNVFYHLGTEILNLPDEVLKIYFEAYEEDTKEKTALLRKQSISRKSVSLSSTSSSSAAMASSAMPTTASPSLPITHGSSTTSCPSMVTTNSPTPPATPITGLTTSSITSSSSSSSTSLSSSTKTGLSSDELFELAVSYHFGQNGKSANKSRAVYFYRQAAVSNHPKSQFYLGLCYLEGVGVVKNYEMAGDWLLKAALQGLTLAQMALANCYREGLGFSENPKLAGFWHAIANKKSFVQQGDAETKEIKNEGMKPIIYLQELAKKDLEAGFILSQCYAVGFLEEKNEKTATELLNAIGAIPKESKDVPVRAHLALGKLSKSQNNSRRAKFYFIKAAGANNPEAIYFLAELNDTEQEKIRAAELGCYEAQLWLANEYAKRASAEEKEVAQAWARYLGNEELAGEFAKSSSPAKKAVDEKSERKSSSSKEIINHEAGIREAKFLAVMESDVEDQLTLAEAYAKGIKPVSRNPELAVAWYRLAAIAGRTKAQTALGICYAEGRGVTQNNTLAHYWLEIASQNDGNALCYLGQCHMKGSLGILKNEDRAIAYFRNAAHLQNHSESQFILGEIRMEQAREKGYFLGLYQEATNYYRRATDPGPGRPIYLMAFVQLGRSYEYGLGVTRDLDQAEKNYEIGLRYNHLPSRFALAKLKIKKKNFFEAFELCETFAGSKEKRAEGDPEALCIIGKLYAQGLGRPKIPQEAFNCFTQAAAKGHAEAEFELSQCYTTGSGVTKDESAAAFYLQRAADKKFLPASLALVKFYLERNEKGLEEKGKVSDQKVDSAIEDLKAAVLAPQPETQELAAQGAAVLGDYFKFKSDIVESEKWKKKASELSDSNAASRRNLEDKGSAAAVATSSPFISTSSTSSGSLSSRSTNSSLSLQPTGSTPRLTPN